MTNFWKDKKVVVAGSNGFLGSHFLNELERMGAGVKGLTRYACDLCNTEQTLKAVDGCDVVINCAALDGNAEFKANYSTEIFDTNVRITSSILNAAKQNRIKEIVLVSSVEVYPLKAKNPILEEDDYRKYADQTLDGYVLSKRYSEILASLYATKYGINIYLPRPTNIYGPNDHFSGMKRRAIPSFIHKIISNEPLEIWGNGRQVRQFIYVTDVVHAVLTMVEKKHTGVLNISTKETVALMTLAENICSIFKKDPNVKLIPNNQSGNRSRVVNIERMYKIINFKPLSLKDGLQKTIDWYLKQY